MKAVIVAHTWREVLSFHPGVGNFPGRLVRGRCLRPHTELQEDVRRHVPGMVCFGSNVGIATGCRQSEYCVFRIVEGMNDVVRGSRMIGVLTVNFESYCSCACLQAKTLLF